MCIKSILAALFKLSDKELYLTHPEESQDKNKNVANTSVNSMMLKWLTNYKVPKDDWDFWVTKILINIFDEWEPEQLQYGISKDTPAFSMDFNEGRQLYCLASWFNPGVIAHEEAHNSYSLLTDEQKLNFSVDYNYAKSNKLIKYLFTINSYGLTNDIEAHAEIYRYLAERMPESLKKYYPRLINGE